MPRMDESTEKPAKPQDTAPDLAGMSDEELLHSRICDLKLKIPGTELESRIEKFYAELAAKNISLKPICYLGDEWFCPEGSATIAIPFYLAHPRLKKLEEKMMMEVEGGTEAWCMRLLRHEMGHVLNHAYLLEKDKGWQKLFGPTSMEYSESFRARPYSRRFVRHLDGYYAQSHPEEDFAETVAIWLTPDLDWRHQYQGWTALQKIEYVDHLMHKLAGKPPRVFSKGENQRCSAPALAPRSALQTTAPAIRSGVSRLLRRRSEKVICRAVCFGQRRARRDIPAAIQQIDPQRGLGLDRRAEIYHQSCLARLTERCAELDLRLKSESAAIEIAAYLATLAAHYRLTGKFKDS